MSCSDRFWPIKVYRSSFLSRAGLVQRWLISSIWYIITIPKPDLFLQMDYHCMIIPELGKSGRKNLAEMPYCSFKPSDLVSPTKSWDHLPVYSCKAALSISQCSNNHRTFGPMYILCGILLEKVRTHNAIIHKKKMQQNIKRLAK